MTETRKYEWEIEKTNRDSRQMKCAHYQDGRSNSGENSKGKKENGMGRRRCCVVLNCLALTYVIINEVFYYTTTSTFS